MHDVYTPEPVPDTQPIPITCPGQHIGTPYIPRSPDKIAAIVMCEIPDGNSELAPADDTMQAIAANLTFFLRGQDEAGRLPLPLLQSGVGGVANAALSCLEQ